MRLTNRISRAGYVTILIFIKRQIRFINIELNERKQLYRNDKRTLKNTK